MYGPDVRPILAALYDAPIPPATLRVAVGLIAAANEYGHIVLEWEQYLEVAQCNDVQAARRHLTRLRQQQIIDFTTNGKVWIHIRHWPADDQRAPESARIRAESPELSPSAAQEEPQRAPESARIRAESPELSPPAARKRAETSAYTRRNGDNFLSKLTKEEEEDHTDTMLAIRELLEDEGLDLTNLPIPDHLTLAHAREIITKFHDDRRAHDNVTLGALAYRIKNARPRRRNQYDALTLR